MERDDCGVYNTCIDVKGRMEMESLELETSRLLYGKLPDGSSLNYNRICDVIDEVFGNKKVKYKAAERFMYQYKDALKNWNVIMDRYCYVSSVVHPDSDEEGHFMDDPVKLYLEREEIADELPDLENLLKISELECDRAKTNVCRMISMLKKDTWKLVMTARYICMVDWPRISRVYGHDDKWAKTLHWTALAKIENALENGYVYEPDKDAVKEVNDLVLKWKVAERDAGLDDNLKFYDLDDFRWLLNMDASVTVRKVKRQNGGAVNDQG